MPRARRLTPKQRRELIEHLQALVESLGQVWGGYERGGIVTVFVEGYEHWFDDLPEAQGTIESWVSDFDAGKMGWIDEVVALHSYDSEEEGGGYYQRLKYLRRLRKLRSMRWWTQRLERINQRLQNGQRLQRSRGRLAVAHN